MQNCLSCTLLDILIIRNTKVDSIASSYRYTIIPVLQLVLLIDEQDSSFLVRIDFQTMASSFVGDLTVAGITQSYCPLYPLPGGI